MQSFRGGSWVLVMLAAFNRALFSAATKLVKDTGYSIDIPLVPQLLEVVGMAPEQSRVVKQDRLKTRQVL